MFKVDKQSKLPKTQSKSSLRNNTSSSTNPQPTDLSTHHSTNLSVAGPHDSIRGNNKL